MADPIANQHEKWSETFVARPDFLGSEPSEPGRAALARFSMAEVAEVLELGPGRGRDTLLFAQGGLRVIALDHAEAGLSQIAAKAETHGLDASIQTLLGDVRSPPPLADEGVDACYAHMLFCMALTTAEIERLMSEVRRVLRPGGLLVYTVRTTADAHLGWASTAAMIDGRLEASSSTSSTMRSSTASPAGSRSLRSRITRRAACRAALRRSR